MRSPGIIRNLVDLVVTLCVMVLSIEYYLPGYLNKPIYVEILTWVALVGVVGMSCISAIRSIAFGMILGIFDRNFWHTVKQGLLLGVGHGLGRLWPYAFAWAVGCYLGEGPIWHIALLALTGGVLFGLHRLLNMLWDSLKQAAN